LIKVLTKSQTDIDSLTTDRSQPLSDELLVTPQTTSVTDRQTVHGRINHWASNLAKALGPQTNSTLKNASVF